MPIRFPALLDVDQFATIHRRRLLQSLGASALLTATGGLFRGRSGPARSSQPIRSRSASPPAIRRRTAS